MNRLNPRTWKISDPWVVLLLLLFILIPFFFTLATVEQPRPLYTAPLWNTPHGYTRSLTIFAVPVMGLAIWLFSRPGSQIQKGAFWNAGFVLTSMGIVLDVVFGHVFLKFENKASTLGPPWTFPCFPFDGKSWLPDEELAFYLLGMFMVLLLYVWGDEVWFEKYNQPDAPRLFKKRFEGLHYNSLIFGLLALVIAWIICTKIPMQDGKPRIGPGYFAYIDIVAFIPTIVLFRVVRDFINWRAFSMVVIYILLISSAWEALLAIPYQWWGYREEYMIGISCYGLFGLPIEAILVWLAVSWTAIVVYEYLSTRKKANTNMMLSASDEKWWKLDFWK